mmetsp:Transcript_5872/g.10912  ORF Transcript_5872/g.10912 Transcript_5872/m.10912 type:complete len:216 (-) Transcript_5872:341-988(-)
MRGHKRFPNLVITYPCELADSDNNCFTVPLLVIVALFGVVHAAIKGNLRFFTRVFGKLLLVVLVDLELQSTSRKATDFHHQWIFFKVLFHLSAFFGGEIIPVGVGIFGCLLLLFALLDNVFKHVVARVVIEVAEIFPSFPCKGGRGIKTFQVSTNDLKKHLYICTNVVELTLLQQVLLINKLGKVSDTMSMKQRSLVPFGYLIHKLFESLIVRHV